MSKQTNEGCEAQEVGGWGGTGASIFGDFEEDFTATY